MYQASDDFKTAVVRDGRKIKIKLLAGKNEISSDIISVMLTSRSCSSDFFEIGGAATSYVEIEMYEQDYDLKNMEIEVVADVLLADGSYESCPMGLYTVTQPELDDGIVRFTAYDRMYTRMSGAYFSDLAYPTDAKNALKEIGKKTGVEIDTSNLIDGVMLDKRETSTGQNVDENGNVVTEKTYANPLDGYSCKEALGYIAMLYGKIAYVDKNGKVVFSWYTTFDYVVGTDRYYDDLITGNVFKPGTIVCQNGDSQITAGNGAANTQTENPVMTQERLAAIYQQIKELEFVPASFSFYGDPSLEIGDQITVNDKRGNVVKVPIMSIVQEYDGGLLTRIQSFGGTESANEIKSPTAQKIDRVYTELFFVKELVGEKANFDYVHAIKGEFDELYAKSITTDNIEAAIGKFGYVTADQIDAKYARIDLANIKAGAVTTAMIATGAIQTAQIADGSITDAKIVGLTANKITAGKLDAAEIEVVNLNAANITVGTINGKQIANGAIDQNKLSSALSGIINDASDTANSALESATSANALASSAASSASRAQTTADGKNTVFYQSTAPSTSGRKVNDIWFDTSNGNAMYRFNGTKWVSEQFGSDAIDDGIISADKIAAEVNQKIDDAFTTANSAQESADKAIKSSIAEFYQSTSPTALSGGTWSTSQPVWKDGTYIWTRTLITYGDNSSEYSPSAAGVRITGNTGARGLQGIQGEKGEQGIPGTNGADGKTSYLHIAYANSADGKTGFDVSVSTGKLYIGQYTDFVQADSADPTKYSWTKIKGDTGATGATGAKGDKGDTGANGKSIGTITNYYLATASASGITTATSGWTTTVQSVSTSKKYLWNYEVIKYSDGTVATTSTPCIIGAYGDTGAKGDKGDKGATGSAGATGATGNGISSITEYYQVSTSNTTAPTSWATTVPAMTATNKYLWNYEVIKYTNGSSAETGKRVIGAYGDKGATGAQGEKGEQGIPGEKGDKGDTGATGNGIASTTSTYQVSNSQTKTPTGEWSNEPQKTTAEKPYLWTKTVWTYTDGKQATSYSVSSTIDGVEVGGRNLARKTSSEWSDWFTPENKANASRIYYIIYPGDKKVGDIFTVSFDIDVKKFTGSGDGTFKLYAQGAVDGKWQIQNTFATGRYNFTQKVLEGDYTEHVSYLCTISNEATAEATAFNFGIRCDYSDGTGSVRFKNFKAERGNKATDWTPAPEDVDANIEKTEAIANSALTNASRAQTTADGKNTVFYQSTAPSTTGRKVNDIWFDTSNGNAMYCYTGASWAAKQFGTSAIANLAITNALIADATIQSGKIANLDAGKITSGYIDAERIKTASLTADKLATKTINAASGVIADAAIVSANIADLAVTSGKIANASVGTAKIADLSVTNAKIANLAITAAKIADATITNAKIANLDASKITSGYIDADRINTGSITYAKLDSAAVSAINALVEVGGRNIFTSSKLTNGKPENGNWRQGRINNATVPEWTEEGCYFETPDEGSATSNGAAFLIKRSASGLKTGDIVTFSADVKGEIGSGTPYVQYWSTTKENSVQWARVVRGDSVLGISKDAYTRFSVTVVLEDQYSDSSEDLFAVAGGFNSSVWVKNIKLERGNKATDWTPAPEDAEAEIAEQGIGNWCYNNDLTYINGGKIYTGTVTANAIAANAITSGKIAANAVTATAIAAGAITADKIAVNAVTAEKLASKSITTDKIVAEAITSEQIATKTITATNIAANAITAAEIASATITGDKIAANAITADKISSKTITADSGIIANAAITTANIADLSVTNAKIANLAITAAKIADATITNAKIANLDASKITSGYIDADRIKAGSITSTMLSSDSVTADKIDVSTLSAIAANLGTITAGIIQSATYSYASGDFATAGMQINLTDAGYIRAKNFAINADGSVNVTGGINAISFRVKEDIIFYDDESDYTTGISGYANQLHLGVKSLNSDPGRTINHGSFDVKGEANIENDLSVGGGLGVVGSVYAAAFYENGTALSEKYAPKSHSHNYLSTSGGTITGDLNLSKGALKMGGVQVYDRLISDTDFTYFWRATLAGNLCPFTGKSIAGTASAGEVSIGNSSAYINNLYYGGSLSKQSDRRAKNDLGDIQDSEALTLLRGAKPKKFTYKSDKEKIVQYGAYAQDVRDLLHESGIGHTALIGIDIIGDDGKRTKDLMHPEENVRYSLDYEQYIPLLIVGWKNHEKQLSEQRTLISKIQTENAMIKAENAQLHARLVELEQEAV